MSREKMDKFEIIVYNAKSGNGDGSFFHFLRRRKK